MKLTLSLLVLTSVGFSAHAYQDGTYECKNQGKGLPNNVYKIKTVDFSGLSLPLIEARLFYRAAGADESSPVIESRLSGLATVGTIKAGDESLLLGALRLKFEKNLLSNCQKN